MRFTNLTRHNEIGANSYLLELGGRQLVLDCGMHPKHEGDDATPNLRLVPDDSSATARPTSTRRFGSRAGCANSGAWTASGSPDRKRRR